MRKIVWDVVGRALGSTLITLGLLVAMGWEF